MQNSAEGAESMDQAIRQTGERARQYQEDAEAAAEQNLQSEAQISETEDAVAQTEARIDEMRSANDASQEQIENADPGPALIRSCPDLRQARRSFKVNPIGYPTGFIA